jgi:hypothetical protein
VSGPLTQILEAFGAGATSLAEVARRTGLTDDVVRAGVDHLVRIGRLQASELAQGCPGGGMRLVCLRDRGGGSPAAGPPDPARAGAAPSSWR